MIRAAWGPPRLSIAGECARRGTDAVVEGCVRLLGGDDVDPGLVAALAGPGARDWLDLAPDDPQRYWLRVWGARGLLWAWAEHATPAIGAALTDPAWRVREMAAKVIARHGVGDLLEPVAELRDDPTARVRAAADRAVTILTAQEA